MDGAITTSGAATPRELSTGLSRENGRRQRMVVGRMKTHTLNVDAGAEPRGWMSPDHAWSGSHAQRLRRHPKKHFGPKFGSNVGSAQDRPELVPVGGNNHTNSCDI